MIEVDFSTALVLYLFAYLGVVLVMWSRYEWKQRALRGKPKKLSKKSEV
jgi:hypothetical protein